MTTVNATDGGNYNISIFRHTSASGAISTATFDPVANLNSGSIAVAIGDLDGDGRADLALPVQSGELTGNVVGIMRNNPLFPPSVPPSNIVFNSTGSTTTTVTWTKGNGTATAVFISAATGGNLALKNFTTYTPDPAFGKGTLVTGSSKWYCVYNDIGDSVKLTGLSSGATYNVMAIAYTGSPGAENYLNAGGTGNPAVFTTLTGGAVAIDSIRRLTSSPTNTATVQFTVGFAAPVTGLKATNFSLAVSGSITGAGITAVTGSGSSYTVTVNTGNGNGTIGLNLANASGLSNVISTPLPFTDGVYTIDKIAPAKPPVITSFSPANGPVGTVVTIKGTGFGSTTANNIVFFGATMAKVTAAGSTSLTVTVPAGATYQPITVLNGSTALTGYSAQPFNTTFTPRMGSITGADFNVRLAINTSGYGSGIVISDVDGDGKPDLVIANTGNNTISVFRNTSSSGSITAGSFGPQVDFPGSYGPFKLAVGDLDGDGKPDLAVSNDTTISIFRNISSPGNINTGSFAAKVDLPVVHLLYNYTSSNIVISDLDGDGKPDLIVNYSDITIFSIFRNVSTVGVLSANSFAPRVDLDNGGRPFTQGVNYVNEIAVGDLDGDGKPDLAITDELSNTVSIWRNTTNVGAINSTGSFATPVRFPTGRQPVSVSIGDLDGDGKSELAIGNFGDYTISVFHNTSSSGSITAGSFAARVDLASEAYDLSNIITIGDIDGDGKPELIAATDFGSTVSIFRNLSTKGVISPSSFASRIDLVSGPYSFGVAVGDLDGDGRPDIAVINGSANSGGRTISILHNNPFFAPTVPATNVTFSNIKTNSITASWANGNGLERAVFMAEVSGGNALPINSIQYAANPMFGSGAQIGTSGWYCVYDSTGTSVNITGLSSGASYRVMVVEHNGTTGSEYYLTAPSAGNPANVTTLAGGDVAIDSISLVTGSPTDAALVQYKVVFGSPVTGLSPANFALAVTGAISGAVITTVSGSGGNYLITVNTGTGTGTIGLSLVNGTGLSPALITSLPFTGSAYIVHKSPPADNAPVIISFSPAKGPTGTAVVIQGTGFNSTAADNIVFFGATMARVTAASATSLTVSVPAGATYLRISVLNTANALTGFSSQPFLTTFTPSKGTITAADFLPPVVLTTGIGATSAIISDIDGDGKPDLVIANVYSNTISILRNISAGGLITPASFAPKVDFPTGNYPGGMVVGDLDGDGKPDIAFLTESNKITIFRNTSTRGSITTGSFAPGIDIIAGPTSGPLLISDIDGDGKPDLIFKTSVEPNNSPPSSFVDTIFVMRNISSRGALTSKSFAPKVNMHVGHGEVDWSFTVGDLDGDGKPELIIAAFSYYQIAVLHNIATAGSITPNSFAAPFVFTTFVGPNSVEIGDMDGDGKPDLVINSGAAVLRNTSTVGSITGSSFAAHVDYPSPGSTAFSFGDFDGDGKPDIAGVAKTVTIAHNTTTPGAINSGSFDPVVQLNSATSIETVNYSLAIGDLDGDGRPDLVVPVYTQNELTGVEVFQNAPFISPVTQATNVIFSKTAANSTTASWTNGNGQSRAVFIGATSAGSPLPINRTTYSANATYGTGTQIGTTGWYCIYNGTGSTVNITGLSSATTYRVMVVEYTGAVGAQNFLTDTATRNPANVTTLPGGPVAINSISLVSPIFTNLASVQFKTTFASAITGVTAADFKLATTGAVTGTSITSVSGSGVSYIITVNAGTGDGTIGLNLVSAIGVKPGIITPLPFTGAVYTIDRTLPAITISNPSVSSVLSGTDTVSYTVNYADIHFYTSNLTASSITQNSTGTAKGTVTISGSDTSYVVNISNITGSGSLGISIAASTASDFAGNNAPAAGPSATFLVDPVLANLTISSGTLAPVFSSITLSYLAQVSNSTSSLLVTPTPADPTATVTLNGGNPSIPINLVVGLNNITIKVTSPDGKASTIYTLSVTRAAPGVTGLPPKIAYGNGSIVLANAQPLTAVPTNTGGAVPATDYGQVNTFAGSPTETAGYINATGTAAQFNFPQQMVSDPAGNVYVADANNNAIRKITPAGVVTTFAGSLTGAAGLQDGPGTSALFSYPDGLAVDGTGNLFVADYQNNAIRKIDISGSVTTFYSTVATFGPGGLSFDAAGNLIVAAQDASQIIRITPAGVASIIAGSTPGYINSTGTAAQFNAPADVKADASGNIYVADFNNNAIRKINPSGAVTTIAGSAVSGNAPGYANGVGTAAVFNNPTGLALAPGGIIYVADIYNNDIRRIAPDGTVTLLAGSAAQVPGDADGIGTAAAFNLPVYLNIDVTGTGYVAELGGNRIRKLTLTGYTLKGTLPQGLAFDPTTGTISGTPVIPFTAKTDTITAFNAYGFSTTVVTISYNTASAIATLINLVPSSGTLAPGFASSTTAYTDSVPNAVSSITLAPTASDTTATIMVNGIAVSSGKASGAIPLAVGPNVITTIVTAQDGTTKDTYTVTVNRAALSTIATLNGLTISQGTLTPPFATGILNYSDGVANTITSVTVTPVTTDVNATLQVNGIAVANGTASGVIPLAVGHNTITTVVTAQDGITTATYTIIVTRAASNDATLTDLTLSSGPLTPVFTSGTMSYSAAVANTVTSVTLTPFTNDVNATLTVNGAAVISGTASGAIPLIVGPNTITTVVIAQDGTTKDTYTVIVTRAADADATLVNLTVSQGTLSPVFSSGTISYTDGVSNSTTSITVTPTTSDNTATITVNGSAITSGTASAPIELNVGPNTITTVVTAQDGTTKDTYTVIVTRAPDMDATLVNLTVSQGVLTPVFSSGTISYTDGVPNSTTSVTVTPTTSDNAATITVNGAVVTSGTASAPITLNIGPNTITTIVTAQDGVTKDTYTVIVTRAADADATLLNLTVSQGTLSPVFSSGTTSYTDGVPNSTTSVTVTPTTSDKAATVTVNGASVTSGLPSGAIALAIGPNTITTVITAADGTTTDTYTVIVTRAASSDAALVNLTVSQGTLDPSFSSGTTAYTDSVSDLTTSLTVTPTSSDNTATITVNGFVVKSGIPSDAIPLSPGLNTVTVVVTAQDGITTDTYTITVYRAESLTTLIANNVLTPNGDGKNDVWVIRDIQLFPQNNVTVFDKAGRVVYAKHGYNNDWDGTLNGAPLAEGTYYYIVDLGVNLRKFKGYIGIVRN